MTAADRWVADQAATWPPMSDRERSLLIRLFEHFARTQQTGEPPGPRHDEGPAPGWKQDPNDQLTLVETSHGRRCQGHSTDHESYDATRTRDGAGTGSEVGP